MKAVCRAAAKVRTPFRHTTQEQIREAMKEKKNARKVVEQYAPVRELDVMSIVARNQLLEKQYGENGDTKVVENINPVLFQNSRILAAASQNQRPNAEEDITVTLLKAYQETKQA